MKKGISFRVTFLVVFVIGSGLCISQIPLTVKIPKIGNHKPQVPQSSTETRNKATDKTSSDDAASASNARSTSDCERDASVEVFLEDIENVRKSVEAFQPGTGTSFAPETQDNYLLLAFSKTRRDERYEGWKEYRSNQRCNKLDPALDALAELARSKLASYKPSVSLFRYHDPTAERLMTSYFKGSTAIKVFNIGLDSAGWRIEKDEIGLPRYRFKWASVYVRDNREEHPFCHVYGARIKQDYAGAGTYSTEIYRSEMEDEMYGCP